MKKTFTLILSLSASLFSVAQTQISNSDFELWENVGSSTEEPTFFNSNKTGSSIASAGSQTCFRDATPHGGSYCVRVESKSYIGTVINGSGTTGVINAPSFTKSEGYIGTINYSSSSDIRRMAFTDRPDSLVGWYKYTSGGTGETGKVTAILHTGDYNDPETPVNGNHPDLSANKIARALYFTPTATNGTWTRFSVPFVYVSASNPTYIMVNFTSSANQTTTIAGSKLWVDDLGLIYNMTTGVKENDKNNFKLYCSDKTVYIDFTGKSDNQSVLNIFDLTGKIIFTQSIEKNKMNTIQLPSSLNTGMYLYQVTGSETQKSGKIIVQ
ncbi:MAG: PCMD domain-containing protein [Bacteroidetes bacterium]|nr:PCMD domain-containing protein [Bacteroidota bacterium]